MIVIKRMPRMAIASMIHVIDEDLRNGFDLEFAIRRKKRLWRKLKLFGIP
jgi:hypothetical protein